ncbi:MAG: hypothetical protein D6794_04480 [Deltaproteobacteria bacterium]|nr:MAG: hypothetical protein D6794_04480 [Deltaproteobacteria bacterium]
MHPQVRLLLGIGGMVIAFGDQRPVCLGLLTVVLVAVSVFLDCGATFWLALLKRLRWFFLAVFLLHLLFFPGHTLLGLPWLSRDGLLRGLLLCWQMLLGFVAAGLLVQTSTPDELAAALGRLLAPLARLSPALRSFLGLLPRAVELLPEVRRHTVELWNRREGLRRKLRHGALADRLGAAGDLLEQMVLELADLGEHHALLVASGSVVTGSEVGSLSRADRRVLVFLGLFFLVWLLT